MGLKHWNNIRSQDFISIALSGKRSVTEVRLRENGLRTRRPFRGPLLTPRHHQQRLAWARTHLQWTGKDGRTTSLVDMPALNIHKAWLRSLLLRRGIFETQ
jgi:hypothetical protein